MRKVNPSDYISLKQRVKAEMNRRNGNGSVVSYGGVAYDYSVVPNALVPILKEHYEKNIVPLRAVNPSNLPLEKAGSIFEREMDQMTAKLSVLEAQSMGETGTSPGSCCNANCTGACVSNCTGGCSGGCTGCSSYCSCSAACMTNCTGCDNTCKGGCEGCNGCSGTCTGCTSCSGTCENGCKGDCWSGGCTGGCSNNCWVDGTTKK